MSGSVARSEYLIEYSSRRQNQQSNAFNTREYLCNINIDTVPPAVRGSGIICTIGKNCPHWIVFCLFSTKRFLHKFLQTLIDVYGAKSAINNF